MKIIQTIAPVLSLILLIAFCTIASLSSGEMSALASPLLGLAIGVAVWHDRSKSAA